MKAKTKKFLFVTGAAIAGYFIVKAMQKKTFADMTPEEKKEYIDRQILQTQKATQGRGQDYKPHAIPSPATPPYVPQGTRLPVGTTVLRNQEGEILSVY